MSITPLQIAIHGNEAAPLGPPKLLTVQELCAVFGFTPGWVYTRTKKDAIDPLPIVRFGLRGIRFDSHKISTYIRQHERHPVSARLESPSGSAPINEKGHFRMSRKRIQAGSVRLREDGDPAWWEGFYREDVITEAGKRVRKRRAVNLGSVKDVRSKKAALQKLAVILEPINQAKCRPKMIMSFRGYIAKYRALKLANLKGTTVHGYENNIEVHFLPEFGDRQLSEIAPEDVQVFINQKRLEGKAHQTLTNMKWGLSSIFESAIKHGYIKENPAANADLPPKGVKEKVKLPTGDQLIRLIEALQEPYSSMVYLVSVSSIRPEELAFKWDDLKAEERNLWIIRAMNKGKFHTPKYQEGHRIVRLSEADVERLLSLKRRVHAQDGDWMFPNRIKKGGAKLKPGPIWHEHILARHIQPVANGLGLPHITWRLLRHWGATELADDGVHVNVLQQRLGHSRASTTMNYYVHVLPPSADAAAGLISDQLGYQIPAEFAVNPVEV
jgi:integrase